MSLRPCLALIAACLLAGLAGCGSSYQDSTKSAVDGMHQVIATYNGARPMDLAGTAAICRTAYDDLEKKSSSLATASPPAQYRQEARHLRAAYTAARAGFRQCSQAAATDNFPAMASAMDKIDAANASINAARLAEH